jgi:hypothetical protein
VVFRESSVVNSDRPRSSSENFVFIGVFVPLLCSEIPSALRLRSPMPSVLTASSFSSLEFPDSVFSTNVSTTGSSTSFSSFKSCVPLLLRFPPGATGVLAMLLLKVFAAFCAAEKTEEKNPPEPGVVEPFSGVGVKGADVILDNLLGPRVADPDRILRCEIILPEAEVTTLEFDVAGSETPRSRSVSKCGELCSVGVGGVFTMRGAVFSPGGGVCGEAFVSMVWIFAVRGRSGEFVTDAGFVTDTGWADDCLSENIELTLDATLPRLPSPPLVLSFRSPPLVPLRSGLVLGLDPSRGLNASLILPTGEGDRFCDPFVGARSDLSNCC